MGRPNPSRVIKFSGANGDREKIFFPVQLTRIGNFTRSILTIGICDGHSILPTCSKKSYLFFDVLRELRVYRQPPKLLAYFLPYTFTPRFVKPSSCHSLRNFLNFELKCLHRVWTAYRKCSKCVLFCILCFQRRFRQLSKILFRKILLYEHFS